MKPEEKDENQIEKAAQNVSATMGMEGIEMTPADMQILREFAKNIKSDGLTDGEVLKQYVKGRRPDGSLIFTIYNDYFNKDPEEGEKTK
jgi:hypothetical protein